MTEMGHATDSLSAIRLHKVIHFADHLTAATRPALRAKGRPLRTAPAPRRNPGPYLNDRCLVRDRHSQFQLQPNARQDAARTVAQRDGMMIAVLEQLARPPKRCIFGGK